MSAQEDRICSLVERVPATDTGTATRNAGREEQLVHCREGRVFKISAMAVAGTANDQQCSSPGRDVGYHMFVRRLRLGRGGAVVDDGAPSFPVLPLRQGQEIDTGDAEGMIYAIPRGGEESSCGSSLEATGPVRRCPQSKEECQEHMEQLSDDDTKKEYLSSLLLPRMEEILGPDEECNPTLTTMTEAYSVSDLTDVLYSSQDTFTFVLRCFH